MKLDEPESAPRRELLLPMINVVFLLLIFLMLMGHIAERPLMKIDPAESQFTEEREKALHLYMDDKGEIQFRSYVGREEALSALRAVLEERLVDEVSPIGSTNSALQGEDVVIRSDSKADFPALLKLAREIQSWSAVRIRLEVRQK